MGPALQIHKFFARRPHVLVLAVSGRIEHVCNSLAVVAHGAAEDQGVIRIQQPAQPARVVRRHCPEVCRTASAHANRRCGTFHDVEETRHDEVAQGVVGLTFDVRKQKGTIGVNDIVARLLVSDGVRAQRKQVLVPLVRDLVRPVTLDSHPPCPCRLHR